MSEELTIALENFAMRPRDRAWFIPLLLSGEIPNLEIGGGRTLRDIQWVELNDLVWEQAVLRVLLVVASQDCKA